MFAPFALCLALSIPAWAEEPKLVLVASAQSPLAELAPGAIRRLYLGLPIVHNGHEIIPLRNTADSTIQEMFLQRVLFMSAQAYGRQESGRVFRTGGNRLREYASLQQLLGALQNEPWSVTYMSLETAASLPALKIISEL
jgi:hypothetical protein